MKKVQLITDGACLGNPGPGGWAYILRFKQFKKEGAGHVAHTTNNQMEIRAAVEGLKELIEPCEVEITTDSEYLKNGITQWIKGWKRNGWKTRDQQPVKNQELWRELDTLTARHRTTWQWTKGHADHPDNNRCDELASAAARQKQP